VSEAYNYEHFPQDLDAASFAAFRKGLRVGEPAPDGEATRLEDGARVRLSEYWCACPVIIELAPSPDRTAGWRRQPWSPWRCGTARRSSGSCSSTFARRIPANVSPTTSP